MTQYVKSTSFASKDALPAGNPLKIVKGTEIDTEFNNIAVAVGTKADLLNPVFTGVPTAATASTGTSTTQLATTAFATATISPFTGSMLMWPTATPPSGFLICNGQSVSRATYAALFAIVGTLFGAGDGSTTFTMPNFGDRMPVGVGGSFSVNQKGGAFDSRLPSHNHSASVSDPGHNHTVARNAGNTSGTNLAGFAANSFDGNNSGPITTTTAFTGISVSIASAGENPSFGNMPPYLGVFFIIKT
jgi:microcystin-dependent protein